MPNCALGWQEHVVRETRLGAKQGDSIELSDELHEQYKFANPYSTKTSYFARGSAHQFYNSSWRVRRLISPRSQEPLRSKQHITNMLGTRSGDVNKLPTVAGEPELQRWTRQGNNGGGGGGGTMRPTTPRTPRGGAMSASDGLQLPKTRAPPQTLLLRPGATSQLSQ